MPRWAQQLLDAQKESDERLKTLESEIRATSKQIKKRKHSPTPEFKFKRNKIQYDLNKSVLDKIENALELSDDEQRCLVLNEGKELLVERNKHIKLAEKYGWETVDCYIEEPLASDSEDDKKIRRAVKESKALKEQKRKIPRTVVKPQAVQARLGVQVSSQRNLNEVNFRHSDKRQVLSPSSENSCFRCGRKGHIARFCRSSMSNEQSRPGAA